MRIVSMSDPQTRSVYVCITGDVDLACEADLIRCEQQLPVDDAPQRIYVDLAAITFGGATLINFLFHIATQPGITLILCRPTPILRQVIEFTLLHESSLVQHHLPQRRLSGDAVAETTPETAAYLDN